MKKFIVITSVFSPSEGIRKFSELPDCKLIVVGDNKTPSNWHSDNADFISISKQKEMLFDLPKVLPLNHYSRKMVGYLNAIQQGADLIIETDDDNIPKENWKFPDFQGTFDCIDKNLGFVNIYQLYSEQNIWQRGLPLNLIINQINLGNHISKKQCKIGVWQGLVDENPDVDAIYRLTDNSTCYFKERAPIALDIGTICPFNTQNTIIRKELFTLLYLPSTVTFRFTDILRGLIAQPIMWLYGYKLGITNATVIQKRNPHDIMEDFRAEIPMYKNVEKILDFVTSSISNLESIESNIYNVYETLLNKSIVSKEEINILEIWLKDLAIIK